jgi:hypothetical protein
MCAAHTAAEYLYLRPHLVVLQLELLFFLCPASENYKKDY